MVIVVLFIPVTPIDYPGLLTANNAEYWLNDNDMKRATTLIKQAFPTVGGLQDTLLGASWEFSKPEKIPMGANYS